ncbi:MAG TPA: acyl-CoA thioesterase [Chitinophagaceae bacterium]|nr:acyl-CoA thioesterase [Chitinophagaceae bacterium]
MLLETSYTIRFNDCDPFGHLNNSRYIDYMLNAREDHLKQFHQLSLDTFYKQGFGWVVTGHEIFFLRPANYNETVVIQSDLLEVDDPHLLVEMRMLDETRTTLKAILWTRFASVNIKTGRKENHTEEFLHTLKGLLATGINPGPGLKARVQELAMTKKAAAIGL